MVVEKGGGGLRMLDVCVQGRNQAGKQRWPLAHTHCLQRHPPLPLLVRACCCHHALCVHAAAANPCHGPPALFAARRLGAAAVVLMLLRRSVVPLRGVGLVVVLPLHVLQQCGGGGCCWHGRPGSSSVEVSGAEGGGHN